MQYQWHDLHQWFHSPKGQKYSGSKVAFGLEVGWLSAYTIGTLYTSPLWLPYLNVTLTPMTLAVGLRARAVTFAS